jgi:phospholipid/cholesterol/gamma-HCH transport system substrate-binding protein
MDDDIKKFRVGMFVLMGFVILGILIVVNSEGGWLGWASQYDMYVKPQRAPGVKIGTPIRKNGILIGRVKKVSTQDGYVLLKLGINKTERIYENETARIGTESFLGDAVVEFLPESKEKRGVLLGNESEVATVEISANPMEIMANFGDLQPRLDETLLVFQDAGKSMRSAGNGVSQLTRSFDDLIKDDQGDLKNLVRNLTTVSKKAELALDSFNAMFENLNNIVGDPKLKSEFKNALAELPKIFQEIRVTISDTRKTVQQFGTIPENVNGTLKVANGTLKNVDDTLSNVNGFAATLNKEGPEIVGKVKSSLESVDKFLGDIKKFTKQFENIQDNNGTIAKLLNDDEIYNSLLSTARNVQEVSVRLEPLMDDIRLFTDAVARDPGVLGVRGALDRRPSKTGYKGNAGRNGLLGIPRER